MGSREESRVFSREFKLEAVRRIEAGENVSALSRELRVKREMLYRWRDAHRLGGPEALRLRGRPSKADTLVMGRARGLSAKANDLADAAQEVNGAVENIGARRLQTILEKVVEEVSFAAGDRSGETIAIDADYVRERVGELAKNADLSRFIL